MYSHLFYVNKVILGLTRLRNHSHFDKEPVTLVQIKLDSLNSKCHKGYMAFYNIHLLVV